MRNKNFKMMGIYGLAMAGITSVAALSFVYAKEMNNDAATIVAIESKGFNDVELKGYEWNCKRLTTIKRSFEATNSNGERVKGRICDGALHRFENTLETEVIPHKKNKM